MIMPNSEKLPFRFALPAVQTVVALLSGGLGLWQRYQVLNQPFWGDQTLWNSTARYHVWPLPFKFAVITNMPAFLAAGVIELPVRAIWPKMPEALGWTPDILLIPVLWYWIGRRFDAQPRRNRCWFVLAVFTLFCAIGMLTPGHVGYVPYGILLWVIFGLTLVRATLRS